MPRLQTTLCELIKEAVAAAQDSRQQTAQNSDPATVLSLTIDHIPEIKNYLDPYLRRYYDQALPATEKDVRQNIHRFIEKYPLDLAQINCQTIDDAALVKKHFIKWVKMILTADCIDVRRRKNQPPLSLNDPIGRDSEVGTREDLVDDRTIEGIPKLSGLDKWLEEEQRSTQIKVATEIRAYIETDPDEKLRTCHPRNIPNCNCQVLLRMFLLEEINNITAIANRLKVSRATIQPYLEKIAGREDTSAKCLKLLREFMESTLEIDRSQFLD